MGYVRPAQGILRDVRNSKKTKRGEERKKEKAKNGKTLTTPLRYQVRTDMNDGAKLTGVYHTQHGMANYRLTL